MITNFLMWISANMPAKAIDLNGQYYIERYHVITISKLTLLLHRYFGADGDRHVHNHPHQLSIGIPLKGGYVEETLVGLCPSRGLITKPTFVNFWRWNIIKRKDFHRIAAVDIGTWTLFITYNRCQNWGELKPHPDFKEGLVFTRAEGVKGETKNDWYKKAIKGKALREQRGTDYAPPVPDALFVIFLLTSAILLTAVLARILGATP